MDKNILMRVLGALKAFMEYIFTKPPEPEQPAPVSPLPQFPETPEPPLEEPPAIITRIFLGDASNPLYEGNFVVQPRSIINVEFLQKKEGRFVCGIFVDGRFIEQRSFTLSDQFKNGRRGVFTFLYPNAPVAVHQPGQHEIQFEFLPPGVSFEEPGRTPFYVSPIFPVTIRE